MLLYFTYVKGKESFLHLCHTNKQLEIMNDLNENELRVFNAIFEAHNYNGGDFAYTDDVKVDGITSNQLKGYFSQLKQKGYIVPCEEYGMVNFAEKAIEVNKNILTDCEIYR